MNKSSVYSMKSALTNVHDVYCCLVSTPPPSTLCFTQQNLQVLQAVCVYGLQHQEAVKKKFKLNLGEITIHVISFNNMCSGEVRWCRARRVL